MGAPAGLAQGASRTIDARDIPVPEAASQVLRDSIAAMPLMPVGDSTPSTVAEWEEFVQQRDGAAGVMEAVLIANRARLQVLAVDYRMPPAHPFPAAVDDAVAVYRHMLENRPASSIALGGTSAGGGLTLATVHKLIELGVEVPGAIYLGTPWADLTDTSDTLHTNEAIDRVLLTYDGWIGGAARLYAGNHELTHRLISPLYGDFDGFPPAYLVSGTRDMLLSDTVRVHRKLREAGVVADLNVYEGMSHADYMIVANSPESEQVYAELGAFLVDHLK
jgi:acetyl esterase/lipase